MNLYRSTCRRIAGLARNASVCLLFAWFAGCSTLPPGTGYPKVASTALAHPEETHLGQAFRADEKRHGGDSGFRIVPVGANGFLIRMQLVNAAERTLDLQYFIFRGDETGRLLTSAVLAAADRGVRVRILLDDGETIAGDEQIAALQAHPSVEVRIFNPFAYRGHSTFLRAAEFTLNASRLDYRMHNKLLVVDNAVALVGGRNIGDQYFQVDPASQFADDDVFVAGPMARLLSGTFDEFWNSGLSIPIDALAARRASRKALRDRRVELEAESEQMKVAGADYSKRVAAGEPLAGILDGRLPLVWAHAELVSDSPEKKKVEHGEMVGRLMHRAVARATLAARSELLMVTPYLIPGTDGMGIFADLRRRGLRVRVLTNSLESAEMLPAQAGYMHYRVPLLDMGIELYEIRSLLGNVRGSGQTAAIARFGNYSLHAKLFVFDRQRVFIGSMNFDQRSMHLNTEIGLIIDSPVLAREVSKRFDAMTQPENAYKLALRRGQGSTSPSLIWQTVENGMAEAYDVEPARSQWQRIKANAMAFLPMDSEL